jgi:hypothetical protein
VSDSLVSGGITAIQVNGLFGESRVFLTGVVVEGSEATGSGLTVNGALARVEVKNSAFLGAAPTVGSSVGASVLEGGTLRVANSLFFPAASAEGDAIGVDVDQGEATLVNCLMRGASVAGVSAAVRIGEGAHATLVANDLYGPDQDALLVSNEVVSDVETLDGCGWAGCDEARLSRSVDPHFEDLASSFRLIAASPLVDAGIDPSPYGLVVDRDIDGNPAPLDGDGDSVPFWDVGPSER